MSIRKLGVTFEGAKVVVQKPENVAKDRYHQEMRAAQRSMVDGMQAAKEGGSDYTTKQDFQDALEKSKRFKRELSHLFGYHANGTPDYVVSDAVVLERMANAAEDVKDVLSDALRKRRAQSDRLKETLEQEQLNRLAGDEMEANMLAQRAKIQRMLVNAQNTELNVAFFFGSSINELDSRNPDGTRQGFRTDIETLDFMVEVTIGQRKNVQQLNDYVAAKTVRQELIMYAPNMDQAWVDRHVTSRGFHHVRNFAELSATIQKLRR